MPRLVRTTFVFSLLSGGEEARVSCHWFSPTAASVVSLSANVSAELTDYWNILNDYYEARTTFLGVECQERDIVTGQFTGPNVIVPFAGIGFVNGTQLPLQLAGVVSVRTATAGPRGRGRMYMPPPASVALASDAQMTTAYRDDVLLAWQGLVSGVQGAGDFDLGVYSRVGAAFSTADSLDMGRIYDTQRSRRSELVEARASVAV